VIRGTWLVALALPGCAALAESDWDAQALHPPLRPYHVVIFDAEMDHACGVRPGSYTYGCAVRIVSENLCLVYTRPEPAAWIMVHEYKHCNGWDHGQVRRQ